MSRFLSSPIKTRSELTHFESYRPGLSVEELRRQYGLKKIIKLASNENPLGPSKKAMDAFKKTSERLFRYPESRSLDLRRAVAGRFKRDQLEVIIGAGSDEIIELLAMAYLTPADSIVVSASSFMQYKLAAKLMGSQVITVPMNGLTCDLPAMVKAVQSNTKFVFLANPNNPTGTFNKRDEMARFLNELPAHVLPVIDEAYFEYAVVNPDYPSMLDEVYGKRPMVVLRTFSKVYGLAGLRVGYGIAPEACVEAMDKIRSPFNVSVPAQAAAVAALDDDAHVRKSVALNEKEKKSLTEALKKMQLTVVPTAANFLLFNVEPRKGRAVFDRLLHYGVIARAVDEYGLPGYVRVTVGTKDENKIFLSALREVLNQI